jgi:ABC-2 type transport system permease protein
VSVRNALLPAGTPRAAFGRLVAGEAKLALRQPSGLIFGLGLPLLLLVIFGLVPKFREPVPGMHGQTLFTVYVPVLLALSIAALALWGLPGPLATYREQGILRRLSTTPAPPVWLLAATLVVNVVLAVMAVAVVLVAATVGFGVDDPGQPAGLALALALCTAALFALGLLIAAVARGAAMAGALGSAAFFPLMFFAGLWVPRPVMPELLRRVGDFTPLGAGVQALQSAMQGDFPSATPLLVLAAWAVVLGSLAVRFFRWE